MKKILIVISLIFIMFLFGCGKSEHFETPVSFYYPCAKISYGSIDSFISSEQRESADSSMSTLIEAYFRGPLDDKFQNPFPADVTLIKCTAEDNSIQLILSDSYASLSGTKLSVANACITKTLTKYYGVESISISCESKDLDGEKLITIAATDLVFLDQSTGFASSIAENTAETQE